MVDPDVSSGTAESSESEVCADIGRAIGSVVQRRSGARPSAVHTEFVGDVVRCTIDEAPGDGDIASMPISELAPSEVRGYEREAGATVARLTGRAVVGFIATPAAGSASTTNTFILDAVRTRY